MEYIFCLGLANGFWLGYEDGFQLGFTDGSYNQHQKEGFWLKA
jgi:hypothetical protein